MSRLTKATIGLLVLLLALAAPAATAAQDTSDVFFLRSVDSRDPGAVKMDLVYGGDPAHLEDLALTENGTTVEDFEVGPRPDGDPPQDVVFVVDTSQPMAESGSLDAARTAIAAWAQQAPPSMRIGVVEAGVEATQIQSLTTSSRLITSAVERLEPSGTSSGATWSALRVAAASLSGSAAGNVVVVAGSPDRVTAPEQRVAARGTLESVGAPLWVAAFTGDGYDPSSWASVVGNVGGMILQAGEGSETGEAVTDLEEVLTDDQYRVTFPSTTAEELAAHLEAAGEEADGGAIITRGEGPSADLRISVGGQTADALLLPGGLAVGQGALSPDRVDPGGGIELLQGQLGLFVTMMVILAAAALLAFAVVSIVARNDALSATLAPYDEAMSLESPLEEDHSRPAFVERAAELAEQVAEERGFLAKVEGALERANVPLRAGEAMSFYVAGVVAVMILGLIVFRNPFGAVIFGVVGAAIPAAVLNIMAAMRRKKFMAQLPDTLQLLAGTLRAGYSLMQGVEAVANEIEDPMGLELRRVVTEARLGREVEDALDQVAERMGSVDFEWAVMAIRIQREVGGNLSELLMTVSETMVARERLRRDVASLTAEGRMSAIVLGILPPGLAVVMYGMNPDYIGTLFTEGIGIAMVVLAVISMLIGFAWMRKIITIEV